MSVIRSAGLRGFRTVVTELGGDPEALAMQAGLPTSALDEDELLVSDAAVAIAYELAGESLQCPDFGLRVAKYQDLAMLGALALAIQNSPTLSDALTCTERYLFVHAQSLSVHLTDDPHEEPGVAAIELRTAPGLPTPPQATDVSLMFLHNSISYLVGGYYGLRSVELPYRPAAPLQRYEEAFGTRVRIGDMAALRVPVNLTARSLTGVDSTARGLALQYLESKADTSGPQTTAQVRAAIEHLLGTSVPDINSVSRVLALHPRTVQRRLAKEGTTFAQILDEQRRLAAHRYLTTTDMPFTQVAALVGLSEQSALSRCARRWWDKTPREIRTNAA